MLTKLINTSKCSNSCRAVGVARRWAGHGLKLIDCQCTHSIIHCIANDINEIYTIYTDIYGCIQMCIIYADEYVNITVINAINVECLARGGRERRDERRDEYISRDFPIFRCDFHARHMQD